MLEWLLSGFPDAGSVLEVGCGTGRFTRWLATRMTPAIGLDRAPAMLSEARRLAPDLPLVIGNSDALPFRTCGVDLVAFITTLEFLPDADRAIAEAVRVARLGVIILALNSWSLGGLSRRYGSQRRRPLLGKAQDLSILALRSTVDGAASDRLQGIRWSSTLFALCHAARLPLPLGEVLGLAVDLRA